jgi:hypothetical protein
MICKTEYFLEIVCSYLYSADIEKAGVDWVQSKVLLKLGVYGNNSYREMVDSVICWLNHNG